MSAVSILLVGATVTCLGFGWADTVRAADASPAASVDSAATAETSAPPPVPEAQADADTEIDTGTDTGQQLVATEPGLTAQELVQRVNAVAEGKQTVRKLEMILTARDGKQRSRQTISYRKYYEDERRTILYYLEPANVSGTGFLIWDYADYGKDDDQWLYLPALRKVRRISSGDRGDYFLGTDFTYEDIKLDGKLEPRDYRFQFLGAETVAGRSLLKLEAMPVSSEVAEELGYSKVVSWIDPGNWMIQRTEFWDNKEQPLKSLEVTGIELIDGIWTRTGLELVNHQTGHKTEFRFSEIDYATDIDDSRFTKRALERGFY